MSRKDLFDAVRLFAPQHKFTQKAVDLTDALADEFGFPREGSAPPAMRISQAGIALMHSFEGCRLTAYPDPGSSNGEPWTIGWGSTGPGIKKGVVWTQKQADDRFVADLAKYERGVIEALDGAPVTQRQFDALVSFSYNVGLQALRDSTLLKKHKAGDYSAARAQFLRWNKNDGKVMAGLTRRREAEAALYGDA